MDIYINAYMKGYDEGIKDSYIDFLNKTKKEFKEIDKMKIMSFLYDVGYIDGYLNFLKYVFNLE